MTNSSLLTNIGQSCTFFLCADLSFNINISPPVNGYENVCVQRTTIDVTVQDLSTFLLSLRQCLQLAWDSLGRIG